MQYTGRLTTNVDGWNAPNGQKITTVKAGSYIFSAEINGWVSLNYSGRLVWTKRAYVSNYEPLATPPPPPPVEPPPTSECPFKLATIEMTDGSIWQGDQWTKK